MIYEIYFKGCADMKKLCAQKALGLIKNDMIIGLGGGTTISYLIEYIKEADLNVKIVSPSYKTAQLCWQAGLFVVPAHVVHHLDIAFDGCDEVDFDLNALKSGGAIHTKEKIIASMADKYVLLVDETKVFEKLPFNHPVAVEVIPEAKSYVLHKLRLLADKAVLRESSAKDAMTVSDNGNMIIDAYFTNVDNVKELNEILMMTAGIVDTSLFYQIANKAIVVGKSGINIMERK